MFSLTGTIVIITTFQNPAANYDLDFWVGEWEIAGRSRSSPGKDECSVIKATNTITKTLNSKVIEESFSTTGYHGLSWSCYDPNKKIWQQSYVDNSGAYLL